MRRYCLWVAVLLCALSINASADSISFSTFVPSASIAAAEGGNTSVIAFQYAGNEFIGSVYPNNNQLYSTNLLGGNVTPFGSPVPGASGEIVVGASLGQAGFVKGNIFVGNEANTQIYQYANSGGSPTLFTTLPGAAGVVRQILFDPGSSFGGNMLVSTTSGNVYVVNSSGVATLLASVGEDTEGMDIAPSSWGPYAGDLLVGSEGSGTLRLISPGGVVTVVGSVGMFPGAETVSAIPLNLTASNPLEGFYVANYPYNIQFASASQFITQGLLGDVIVTDETGGSTAWDVSYNGSGFTSTPFTFTGNNITQFEDGIFVSPQRVNLATPEPCTLALLGLSLLGLGGTLKRKFFA